jgi:hypothetical protein
MRYLVESYLPAPGDDEMGKVDARMRAAADELARAGAALRFVESIFVPEDEMCLLVYEADTPELVREASLRAGIACERVLEARGSEESSANTEGAQS